MRRCPLQYGVPRPVAALPGPLPAPGGACLTASWLLVGCTALNGAARAGAASALSDVCLAASCRTGAASCSLASVQTAHSAKLPPAEQRSRRAGCGSAAVVRLRWAPARHCQERQLPRRRGVYSPAAGLGSCLQPALEPSHACQLPASPQHSSSCCKQAQWRQGTSDFLAVLRLTLGMLCSQTSRAR